MIGVFKLCLFCEKQYFGLIPILVENLEGHLGHFKIVFVTWKLKHLIRRFETMISAYGSSRSDKE
jgi:hypothetical protein